MKFKCTKKMIKQVYYDTVLLMHVKITSSISIPMPIDLPTRSELRIDKKGPFHFIQSKKEHYIKYITEPL